MIDDLDYIMSEVEKGRLNVTDIKWSHADIYKPTMQIRISDNSFQPRHISPSAFKAYVVERVRCEDLFVIDQNWRRPFVGGPLSATIKAIPSNDGLFFWDISRTFVVDPTSLKAQPPKPEMEVAV